VATFVVFGPIVLVGTYLVQSHGAMSSEAFILSVPVGLLAALIVYVNEIRRRAADAKLGRRTLPVRLSQRVVVGGFSVAAGFAYVSLVAGVALALLPIPVLIALLTIPLAVRIRSGLLHSYDEPHALLNAAAEATLLHTNVSLILLLVYLLTIADQVFLNLKPYLR
jgi:1,4-dihydroxy-2-naphthoate octaprenyltransferase